MNLGPRSVASSCRSLRGKTPTKQTTGSSTALLDALNPRIPRGVSRSFTFTTDENAPLVHKYTAIKVRYASQGGTAQLFAMQLVEALQEQDAAPTVDLAPLNESSPEQELRGDPDALYIFLSSTTGVGEPPDNGRDFVRYLVEHDDLPPIDFCVFGLGNKVAHPSHYNVVSKTIHQRLLDSHSHPILPLAMGNDGDCIEDDFDQWQEILIRRLFGLAEDGSSDVDGGKDSGTSSTCGPSVGDGSQIPSSSADGSRPASNPAEEELLAPCSGSVSGMRRISSKFPMLQLDAAQSTEVRLDLLGGGDAALSRLYPSDAKLWTVRQNRNMNWDPAANGMRELVLEVSQSEESTGAVPLYEAGDHVFVIPRNADCIVEAYLKLLDDVSPHAVIRGVRPDQRSSSNAAYPYPTGLTVYETLSHCVDLSAVPSPAMSRFLMNRKTIDYKEEIAKPRRTVLTLLRENRNPISLEDMLFALTPIRGRYYSIASSVRNHPNEVYLVYRPVRYISDRGYLREGLCTSYMANLSERSKVVARINCNPSFRLPADPQVPIVMMAGGCGIAPIRAFLEERLVLQNQGAQLGQAFLFAGYRNPADEVWADMVRDALQRGTITSAFIAYTTGVPDAALITEVLREQSSTVWDVLQAGGYVYLCGGAQSFGAAVKRELIDLLGQHGKHTADSATSFLQSLAHTGRLCEDLAD